MAGFFALKRGQLGRNKPGIVTIEALSGAARQSVASLAYDGHRFDTIALLESAHDVQTFDDLAEDGVLAVEELGRSEDKKELTVAGVLILWWAGQCNGAFLV